MTQISEMIGILDSFNDNDKHFEIGRARTLGEEGEIEQEKKKELNLQEEEDIQILNLKKSKDIFVTTDNMKKNLNCIDGINDKMRDCSRIMSEVIEIYRQIQVQQLPISNEMIDNLNTKKKSAFADFSVVLRKVHEMIENVKIADVIIVDDKAYGLVNGLESVDRDIFMKLVRIIVDEKKIRIIVGMIKTFYLWTKHRLFLWSRSVAPSFLPNPYCTVVVGRSFIGRRCRFPIFAAGFGTSNAQTIFLDKIIYEGVYRWNVEIMYATESDSYLCVGIASPEVLSACASLALGSVPDSSAFQFRRVSHREGGLSACLLGVKVPKGAGAGSCSSVHAIRYIAFTTDHGQGPLFFSNPFALTVQPITLPGDSSLVPNYSVVSIEVNADAHLLTFSINGEEMPQSIGSIPLPLYLGVSGTCGTSFTSVSFQRIPSDFVVAVDVVSHPAKKKKRRY